MAKNNKLNTTTPAATTDEPTNEVSATSGSNETASVPTTDIPSRKNVQGIQKKKFSLEDFKKAEKRVTYKNKPDRWIPVDKAFQDVTQLKGVLESQSYVLFGYESSGKSTFMLSAAINAQKMGVLPVFLITEQKHRWSHAIEMGFEIEEVVDEETGNIGYEGFFLHYDRNNFNSVEDLAKLIHGLIDKQEAGKLPYNLLFLIDSIGKLNCDKGIKNENQFNPQWIASSLAHEFGASVIPRINMSISEKSEYTNTLCTIVQPWTELPSTYGQLPKLTAKGGKSLPQDSAIVIKFGSDTNSGTSKMKVKKAGHEIVWGVKTRVEIEKNHITNITTRGKLIITKDGFITLDEEKDSDSNFK